MREKWSKYLAHNATSTYGRVNVYGCNALVDVDVEVTYHLKALTPRMKALVLNQYKRGYISSYGGGQQHRLTQALRIHYGCNLSTLRAAGGVSLFNLTSVQKKEIMAMKLLCNVKGVVQTPSKGRLYIGSLTDNTKEEIKNFLYFLQKFIIENEPPEERKKREHVIEMIETGAIFSIQHQML